jgi:SRSO17 transposase
MDFAAVIDGVESFAAYVGELASVIGHVGRVAPLHDYCAGLLASEGRRSVEPMAALTAPAEVSVQHQRLLHFVGEADWSDARVLMKFPPTRQKIS